MSRHNRVGTMQTPTVPVEVIEIEDDSDSEDTMEEFLDLLTAGDGGGLLPSLEHEDLLPPQPLSEDEAHPRSYSPTIARPVDPYEAYKNKVLDVFPDVSLDHVRQLYNGQIQPAHNLRSMAEVDDVAQAIIIQLLDAGKYPTEKDRKKDLKRKRASSVDSDEKELAKWTAFDRPQVPYHYYEEAVKLLQTEFINVPANYIQSQLRQTRYLYPAYLDLELAERTYNGTEPTAYRRLKTARKSRQHNQAMSGTLEPTGYGIEELLRELHAARKKRAKDDAKRQLQQEAADASAATEQKYREMGDVMECQCCFDDLPIYMTTHCDGDEPHFFCLECAKRQADAEVGQSRYKITCMDGSGCKAEFSNEQKERFLDDKTRETLARLQQQAELREAGLEDLEQCPFCDYAAIYPPVKVNRVFRCANPECEKASCRLCKAADHLPRTCEEQKKEDGVSERHLLEEAMTKAILKACPKCKVPLLKDGGCNKMVCSRCRCAVCDYCGKDITKDAYNHFDGGSTVMTALVGAPTQKCPLSDDDVQRNRELLTKAEQKTVAEIRAENPNLTEEDLKIKFSEAVKSTRRPPAFGPPMMGGHPGGLGPGREAFQARMAAEARMAELRRLEQQNRNHQADHRNRLAELEQRNRYRLAALREQAQRDRNWHAQNLQNRNPSSIPNGPRPLNPQPTNMGYAAHVPQGPQNPYSYHTPPQYLPQYPYPPQVQWGVPAQIFPPITLWNGHQNNSQQAPVQQPTQFQHDPRAPPGY